VKRRELIAASLTLPWPSLALAEDAPSEPARAAAIAERVAAVYAKARSFRARFQVSFSRGRYDRAGQTGRVVFLRPDQASWRFANGNRVRADASLVRVFEKEAGHIYETAPSRSLFPSLLSFLDGPLERQFELGVVHAFRFRRGDVIGGRALRPTSACERGFFAVNAQTGLVEAVTLVFGAGERVRYSFTETRLNAPVSAAELALGAPEGADVVRLAQ
jgi:outer membrane lipoprotein-sorting protein